MNDRPAPDKRPSGGTVVLLGLRFLAEIGLLVELAWAGWHLLDGALHLVLAVLLPVLAAVVWGRWVAPRSGHRLGDPARAGVELLLFGGGFVLVTQADPGSVAWALLLLVVYLVSLPVRRVEI